MSPLWNVEIKSAIYATIPVIYARPPIDKISFLKIFLE
jgi:hypothetical protein